MWLRSLLRTFVWPLLTFTQLHAQNQGAEIFRQVSPSIGVLRSFDAKNDGIAQASAFLIDSSGILVTNAHVLDGGVRFTFSLPERAVLPVKVLSVEPRHDLAFMKVETDGKLKALRLGDSDSVSVGEVVYAVGSPQGLENTISNGILSGIRKFGTQDYFLQTTTPISKGSSGGALVNVNGQVIGMTTYFIGGGQNLNFAVPVNLIRDKLPNIKARAKPRKEFTSGPDQQPRLSQPIRIPARESHTYLLLSIAYSALAAKDYDVAQEGFQGVLKVDSTNIDAMKGLAQSLDMRQQYREALSWYEKIIERDSSDAVFFFRAGLAASALKLQDKALAMYEQALKLQPEFWEVWFEMGRLHGEVGEYRQALFAFEKSNQQNPDNWTTLFCLGITASALGDFESAIGWLNQALAHKPDDSETWFKLGLAYYRVDQYTEADSAFAKAVELNPEHGPSWLWRGVAARSAQDHTSAQKHAETALPLLQSKLEKLDCLLLLADCRLNDNDPDQALAYLEEARSLNDADVRVHEQLARAYLAKGDYNKAKQEYSIIEQLKSSANN